MNAAEEQSTLGILDIDHLCNDFDSIFFGDKLDQTANVVTKRQENLRLSLRSSYPSPPMFNDLHGNKQQKPQRDVSEASSRSASSLSVSSVSGINTTAFQQAMDSRYFNESSVFDPTSLRYSDSVSIGAGSEKSVSLDTSASPDTSVLFRGSAHRSSSKLSEVGLPDVPPSDALHTTCTKRRTPAAEVLQQSVPTLPEIGTTMSLPVSMLQSDRILFLPHEIGARSTSVYNIEEHEKGKPKKKTPAKAEVSWNNSGFDIDFDKEEGEDGFSKSTNKEEFLSNGDAILALNEDQRKCEALNAFEISVNHDFGNTSGLYPDLEKSAAGFSLMASNIFGHQSWIGSGKERPSFGMVLQSPIRQVNSTLQSLNLNASFNDLCEPTSDKYQTSYSVPKQKPDRKANVTRRATLADLKESDSEKNASIEFVISEKKSTFSDSKPEPAENSSTLVNTSKENQSDPAMSSSRSLQESPAPSESSSSLQVSQQSCHCSTSSTPSALTLPTYGMVVPARTHLVAPFNWTRVPMDVALPSQPPVYPVSSNVQCNQLTTLTICPAELEPQVICLGERLEVSVPLENPFPESLQCQIVLAGVFASDHLLRHANIDQLISCVQNGTVLLPNQKKNIPVTLTVRVPGQVCATVEVQWTTAGCPTIPSKMGKSSCLLSCEVILPKVSIASKNLTIKYHSFSDTAGTSSFALLNHTLAPVTVSLQILLSGDEDQSWPDAEFFFVVDHVRQLPGNSAHQWLNTASPSVLSLCLAAASAEMPSRADIPLSFKGGQIAHLAKGRAVSSLGATVVVSTQNSQPARRLAAIRISVTSSQVPMPAFQVHSTTDSLTNSSGKDLPSLKSKKHLYFLPTDLFNTRKEDFVLRNCGPTCNITAYVEDESSAFQLCADSCQPKESPWLLGKKETLSIPVAFRPTEKTCYQATLIVTATTGDGCTSSIKIMLHGYGGCSKLSLHECSVNGEALQRQLKVLRFPKGIGDEKQVVFLNRGISHAFVSIAQPSADVSFSVAKFVVSPFSQKTLTIKCHTRNLNQNLLIFHGEELFRQSISKKLAVLKKPSLLHMFDATGPFKDQENVPSEPVYPVKEISALGELFYKHVLHFDIHLTCTSASSSDFVNSSMESTFSMD